MSAAACSSKTRRWRCKNPARPGFKTCGDCAASKRDAYRRSVASGPCVRKGCKRQAEVGYRTCPGCRGLRGPIAKAKPPIGKRQLDPQGPIAWVRLPTQRHLAMLGKLAAMRGETVDALVTRWIEGGAAVLMQARDSIAAVADVPRRGMAS